MVKGEEVEEEEEEKEEEEEEEEEEQEERRGAHESKRQPSPTAGTTVAFVHCVNHPFSGLQRTLGVGVRVFGPVLLVEQGF